MSYRLSQSIAGCVLVATGIGLAWLMHEFPARLKVPPWVGDVAALAFVLAGLLAFCNACGGARARAWLAVTLLVCLIVPGIWLAFGSGDRQCTFSALFLFGMAQDAACRVAYGAFSVVGVGVIVLAIRHALRVGRES